jgi:aspartate kinase
MKKVVKFGGSSLASAKQFKKVGDIIRADKSRRYVVPSAPGKRNKNDTKVTDMLYACYEAASTGASYGKLLSAIKERYEQIIDGLELNLNLDYEFKTIEENFIAKKGSDYAASRGEYLNGIIMSHYLGYEFIDAAEVIFFDENGTFLSEKTNEELSERLAHDPHLLPRWFGYHWLHRSPRDSRRPLRELDRCIRFPGNRPAHRGKSGSDRDHHLQRTA